MNTQLTRFRPPGEADYANSFPVGSWASCVADVAAGYRARYGAAVPFVAGTFSVTQQSYGSFQYMDYLRAAYGQGQYGSPGPTVPFGVYEVLTASTMPSLPSAPSRVGLADAYYALASPQGGGVVPSPALYDPATLIHFSVLGYQARLVMPRDRPFFDVLL